MCQLNRYIYPANSVSNHRFGWKCNACENYWNEYITTKKFISNYSRWYWRLKERYEILWEVLERLRLKWLCQCVNVLTKEAHSFLSQPRHTTCKVSCKRTSKNL